LGDDPVAPRGSNEAHLATVLAVVLLVAVAVGVLCAVLGGRHLPGG